VKLTQAQFDLKMLERTLEPAKLSARKGSSPIGCVIVDSGRHIVSEGCKRSGEPWSRKPHEIGGNGLAHAEMVAFSRAGRSDLQNPEDLTLYTSLEPRRRGHQRLLVKSNTSAWVPLRSAKR
jgi:tRNA(Arg) A34 adenosine deaminase TadA